MAVTVLPQVEVVARRRLAMDFTAAVFPEGAWPIIIAWEGSRSAKAYRAPAGLRAPHPSFRRL